MSQAGKRCFSLLLFLLWSGGVWAQIPFKREAPEAEVSIARLGWGMLICILILGVALYFLRRYLQQQVEQKRARYQGSSQMDVLESRSLGPHAQLHVVRFGARDYLLGSSAQGVVCLASASPEQMPAGHEKQESANVQS